MGAHVPASLRVTGFIPPPPTDLCRELPAGGHDLLSSLQYSIQGLAGLPRFKETRSTEAQAW